MGCDIVAIGTNHNLPVDDPVATATRLIPFANSPISIGYYKYFEYDAAKNAIVDTSFEWCEQTRINCDCGGTPAQFSIEGYNEREIAQALMGALDNIRLPKFLSKDDFENPDTFCIYEFESKRFDLRIFKENVDFDISFAGRWFQFVDKFRQPYEGENRELLFDFRLHIFKQMKACGCDTALYFPDQGDGEYIFNEINLPSKTLLDKIRRGVYSTDSDQLTTFNVADYIQGNIVLPEKSDVLCFIDTFSDLRLSEKI